MADETTPKNDPTGYKLGGEQFLKTVDAVEKALHEGRYGYAVVESLKATFVDIPAHQFSPGDKLETPTVETASAKTPEVKTR
jgi:hypothetical protein